MLNQMKLMMKGELNKVNENNIFPLTRWASGLESNYPICCKINRNIYATNKSVNLTFLSLSMNKKNFIPFPKKIKTKEDKKLDLIVKYLKEFKNYSNDDIKEIISILKVYIKDKKTMEEFAKEYGLSNKERKVLGLKVIDFKKINKQSNQKTLFN